jgi:hypothetical protein
VPEIQTDPVTLDPVAAQRERDEAAARQRAAWWHRTTDAEAEPAGWPARDEFLERKRLEAEQTRAERRKRLQGEPCFFPAGTAPPGQGPTTPPLVQMPRPAAGRYRGRPGEGSA